MQRLSFDTWGKRREVNWQALTPAAIASFDTTLTTRGYTGHEMVDAVDLVHMNGRVYDLEIGKFLSADPHIQELNNMCATASLLERVESAELEPLLLPSQQSIELHGSERVLF